MEQLKGNRKIIILILTVLFIISLFGFTYGYYLSNISGNGKVIRGNTAYLDINFIEGESVKLNNYAPIYDSKKETDAYKKSFSIENRSSDNSTVNAEYDVYLVFSSVDEELKSEFMKWELLKDGKVISNGNLKNIINNEIKLTNEKEVINLDGKKQDLEFRLWMSYSESVNQINMLNKSLTAKLKVKVNETLRSNFPIATDVIIEKYREDNTEGIIKVDQPATVQTKATTEYRYSGSNDVVKNYVNFNGEVWRIIGVFDVDDGTGKIEKRVKLIREVSLGNYSWDSSSSNINTGYGSNQWGESESYLGADLMQELNNLYYNSKSGVCYNGQNNSSITCNFEATGLKEESRKMIDNVKWYTGVLQSGSTSSVTSSQAYVKERSNTVGTVDSGQSITKTSNWTGKIAVMYPSDLAYGSKNCYSTSTALYNYGASSCASSNWLKGLIEWTLTSYESDRAHVLGLSSTSSVGYNTASTAYAIRPTLYLKPNVQIIKGNGTIDDRYEFGL